MHTPQHVFRDQRPASRNPFSSHTVGSCCEARASTYGPLLLPQGKLLIERNSEELNGILRDIAENFMATLEIIYLLSASGG